MSSLQDLLKNASDYLIPKGTGGTIDTINQFANELNKTQQNGWEDITKKLVLESGVNTLMSAYNIKAPDNIRQVSPKDRQTLDQLVSIGDLATKKSSQQTFIEIINGRTTDTDNKATSLNLLDEVGGEAKVANEAGMAYEALNYAKGQFIDPYKFSNHPELVPHSEKLTLQHYNYQTFVEKGGMMDQIMDYVKNNPTKFSTKNVLQAFETERTFMQQVDAKWDEQNKGRTILQDDPSASAKELFGDYVNTVKNFAQNVGDTVVPDPIKDFWDILDNLWKNGATYIEIAAVVGALFAVLWAAGEVRYITSPSSK